MCLERLARCSAQHRGYAVAAAATTLVLLVLLRVLAIDSVAWTTPVVNGGRDWHLSGMSQDNEALANEIALQVKGESEQPYQLQRPHLVDFSQNGQSCFVADLFKGKNSKRTFLEAGGYNGEDLSNSLYLERELGWSGLLVEPDPWNFWSLTKRNRKARALNACLSPSTSASKLTLKQSDTMSRLQRAEEVGTKGIFTQVQCYPLYSVMKAANLTQLNYLALDVEGLEMKVLQTLPWDAVNITVVQVEASHLDGEQSNRNLQRKRNNSRGHAPSTTDSKESQPSASTASTQNANVQLSQAPESTSCPTPVKSSLPNMASMTSGQRELVYFMRQKEYELLALIGEDFIFKKRPYAEY
ncbi:uncharacterized protein LOC108665442 [Hyalella azteca]|uniref:Uncharacterized protein LOC108665442 n=1 Tax=Hyalella azteca TaxID=294128 RepID=A0A8B7N2L9_HYAAZ|nr:uncharacterized protein LOC108665442 [Hyalella azteca]